MTLTKKERELFLRSLSVAANSVGRWAHLDPELSRIADKLWKIHEKNKK